MKRKATLLTLFTAILTLAAVGAVWAQSRSSQSAWLGVFTQSVDKELAQTYKLPADDGLIVNRVVQDSPADRAGLREDDVILKFNGTPVNSATELSRLVRRAKVGDKATLTVFRDGKTMDLTATLDSRDDEADWNLPDTPDSPDTPETPEAPHAMYFSSNQLYLGVSLNNLTDQLADYFGANGGALVTEVDEDSPAAKAGVKAGDVITAVDDEKIGDAGDVRELIGDMKKGESATLHIIRNKQPMTISVAPEIDKDASRQWGNFYVPDIPKINLRLPKTRGLWYGSPQNGFERDALEKEMDDLHKQMDDLRQELLELKKSGH